MRIITSQYKFNECCKQAYRPADAASPHFAAQAIITMPQGALRDLMVAGWQRRNCTYAFGASIVLDGFCFASDEFACKNVQFGEAI